MQLPNDLENLIGYFAYGGKNYSFSKELDYMLSCRGCIPDAFLANSVYVGPVNGPTLSYFYVNNPLKRHNAFYPWCLVCPCAQVFGNVFPYWAHQITAKAFGRLHTYRKTFLKYARCTSDTHRQSFRAWNVLMDRYLGSRVLLDVTSYDVGKWEGLFRDICYQLKFAGFIYPPSDTPPAFGHFYAPSRIFVAHA